MPNQQHSWESTTDELFDWMQNTPDSLAAEIIGDRRPWEPKIPHDEAMSYHLEHLYPPQLLGEMDTSYLAHIMTTGTQEEVRSLAQALDRHVSRKADQAGESRGEAPYPHLDRPAALPGGGY